jgi:hypothetical protein
MPTFDTRGPISVIVELGAGDIRVAAADRIDTVVEVRPGDPGKKSDVAAAEQTRVEYADGVLRIKAPKGWRQYSFRGGREAIDVQIDLPAGSTVRGEAAMAAFHSTGRLGECRFKIAAGEIQVEEAGDVTLRAAAGDIGLGRAAGHCDVTTGSGAVRIGTVDGTAAVKNANGDTEIGEITGDLRVSAANGRVNVDRAHATVAVKTAKGDILLGEVAGGAVLAQTAYGRVDVGIRDGVAAWLDLQTAFGRVENELDAAERPEPGEDVVELKARTAYGDIRVRRSVAEPSGRHECWARPIVPGG